MIPPVPSQPHWLITGSYDEHMLLWDSRFLKPGRHLLDYHNEGGGVWRVKMLPDLSASEGEGRKSMTVAIAGMHRGFDVVRIGG